ncbi:MAG: beta-ketoacyl-ACP synthase III [Thiobacillus sp.]|uniref:beta-ketoacyl-ACP synthase III n=1 Tax=Thiobacillus sp. TaxID=924 RepID=UPI00289487F2|nr:beta-ketoacyl-ACP synthase III [Thiobacillus sp.]MDT3708407.1 beta-ketoacyl-ACP synthase III [Thiobacillus sp.]
MTYSRILGTGSYLPAHILTNADLEKLVDTNDQWIVERTGIRERHIAAEGEFTSDLATRAAQAALESAGLVADDIDLLIVATTTPDLVFPSTACIVQSKLGMTNGRPAFDLQAVCSGFVYALSVADQFIRTGAARHVLVIGAETLSRITDWNDRGNCILWGDGAGAVVVGASSEPGIIATHMHADGRHKELLRTTTGPSTGTNTPALMRMEGNAVFKMAVNTLDRIVDETLEASGLAKSDIDWLVPHQANIRIITATAKKLGMGMDHVVTTVANHGNTSAASVPLAFDVAVRDGRIQRGQTVLMEAFGGGFTWGSALLKY